MHDMICRAGYRRSRIYAGRVCREEVFHREVVEA